MLKEGADPNAPDENGDTPLHLAVSRCGRKFAVLDIVYALLEHGARPNAYNPAGATPLHLAAAKTDDATVWTLLEHYADPLARDPRGQTPLHYAAAAGKWRVAELLAGRGGVNAKDYEGNTPLHLAAAAGEVAATMGLLERGADPWARNNEGELPIDVAKSSDVAKVLKEAMALRRWQHK